MRPEQKVKPPEPVKPETLTGYAIARRRDNTFSVVVLSIRGDTVVSRTETDADTLAAALGRLSQAVQRAHTT